MAVVKNLMVRAGFDASGMYKGVNKAQQSMNQFQRSINKSFGLIKTALITLGVGKIIKDAKDVAVGYESSFNQITRTLGSSSKEFGKWVKDQAYDYGMATDEAYKYGAVYSNLLSGFAKNTTQTATYTKDLLKASAVVASNTGRTMEDTMERIRSGLLGNTEAIEDLGINVNVAMLQSTQAFQQFANGRSWQQLTFQEQQQIRYMAILEQANLKYGDSLANTTATRQLQFTAALRNCQLALGQAFLPIYNVILPALTNFINGLTRVLSVVATFTNTLFGKSKSSGLGSIAGSMSDAASGATDFGDAIGSAGDSAKKTAKEVNRLMGGFDEINSLSKNNEDGGSAGAGSGGAGGGLGDLGALDLGLDQEPDTSGISKAALKIKAVFTELANFIKENKEIILSVVGGIITGLAFYFGGPILNKAISNFIKYFKGIPSMISAALSAVNLPLIAVSLIIAAVAAAIIYLWQTSEGFRNACVQAWQGIKEIVATVWESFLKPIFEAIGTSLSMIWENGLKPLVKAFVDFIEQVSMLLLNLWNSILQPVFNWLAEVLGPVLSTLINIAVYVISGAITAIMVILKAILDFFTWGISIVNKLFTLDWKTIWQDCQNIALDIWNGLKNKCVEIWNLIQDKFKKFNDFLISVFKTDWTKNFGILGDVLNGFYKSIEHIWSAIKNIFGGVIDFVAGVFTGNWDRAFKGIYKIVSGVAEGIGLVFTAPINFITGLLNAMVSAINVAIRGINKLSWKVPDWVPGVGGQKWGFNIPQIPKIPYLAKGGIIDSPTLAMVGEAGKEAVVPLENNKGGLREVANLLLAEMGPRSSNDNNYSGDLILMIDGSVIGKVALKQLRKMQRQGAISLMLK